MEINLAQAIAVTAVSGLTEDWATSTAGECQKFAREVAEEVGGIVGARMDKYRRGTAAATLDAFNTIGQKDGFVIWDARTGEARPPIQDGDFLYKDADAAGFLAGHVGIACNGKHVGLDGGKLVVCENSHYHITHGNSPGFNYNADGAKGWRSIATFGRFTAIVRLA